MPGWQRRAAHATHTLLYLLFFLIPLAGWAYSSAAGFPVVVFGVLPLPDFMPADKAPGAERIEESKRIWERLRTIVESLRPPEGSTARVEIEPPRTAAYLRKENEMEPEILLRARVFHGDEYFKSPTPDEGKRMSAVEGRLKAMGLRADHW